GLPLEPVQRLRQALGCHLELLDTVEAAAVDLPRLAAYAAPRVDRIARRIEVVVECDEVERRADPGHRSDRVQPAEEQVAPAPPVVAERREVRHLLIAICTSSSTAVRSSSSRVLVILSRSTGTISRRGRPFTKPTQRKATASSE